jgi:CRP-like cAMP-binding protein
MNTPKNQLIERLPGKDRLRLLGLCTPVEWTLSQVLCEPGEPTQHVYFPAGAFASLLTAFEGHPALEVGMVGHEGMLGTQVALGVDVWPLHAVVQGPGVAWRIGVHPFRGELEKNRALRWALHRYVEVLMTQMATSAACLRFHEIQPRLARWLLMSQDRARSRRFTVTHEFLAYMLGVRRAGITTAARALQAKGLITYHRGELTVLDRGGLRAVACSCYQSDRQVYQSLLP